MSWGSGEMLEYSKHYSDARNPQRDFAALLVCSEAAGACPAVTGASIRIPCPFTDPKEADGTPEEDLRYAERRDEMGRFMLSVCRHVAESQAR
jgi:arsenate reductase